MRNKAIKTIIGPVIVALALAGLAFTLSECSTVRALAPCVVHSDSCN